MNTGAKKATERLHQVLADTSGLTKAELRRQLQQEGVDVNAFLKRLRAEVPGGPAIPVATGAVAQADIAQFLSHQTNELPLAARESETKRTKPTV